VLKFIIESGDLVTQKDIGIGLGKAPTNVSGYYFKPLKDIGVIEVKKQVGNLKYWGLTQEYVVLKKLVLLEKRAEEHLENVREQLLLI
jgi:hypothetical protein